MTLAYSLIPAQFVDSGPTSVVSGHVQTSPFARFVFDAAPGATQLNLTAYQSMDAQFPGWAELSVRINGAFYQSLTYSGPAGDYTQSIVLPSGPKRIEITNGGQSKPPSVGLVGTFLTKVECDAPITACDPNKRVLIYGDSITVGANSVSLIQQGWTNLLRNAASYRVAVEAWGWRSLWDDCATSTQRTAFVNLVKAYNPTHLYLAIGTNDYGLNKWSALGFGGAYVALVDALHTALPSLVIIAQSPLSRSSEAANSFGNILGDYRTQINAIWSTRQSWMQLVQGSGMLSTSDLDDGVHPTTIGDGKLFQFVSQPSVLGL